MGKNMANSKVPAYVSIYNSLYHDIISGVYAPGAHLPAEAVLAEKYKVSRNTLRQALAILNEDGYITKSRGRGKGTIVNPHPNIGHYRNSGNPMVTFANRAITDIKVTYNFSVPTDIATDKLNLSKSDIVLASDLVYLSDDKAIGYSFVQIPMATLSSLEVDVSSEDNIYDLVTKTIYENVLRQEISVKLVFANESESQFLGIQEDEPLLLIESLLYREGQNPSARCKFYFLNEFYKIKYLLS